MAEDEKMQVFLSWSGNLSKQVADLLKNWLEGVLQGIKVWASYEDIDKGALWFGDVMKKLASTNMGIICLTKENKDAPWVMFEAGGLTKGLGPARVCTFLIDLDYRDLNAPLSQFHGTKFTKADLKQLIRTINKNLPSPVQLDEAKLTKTFELWWNELVFGFHKLMSEFQKDHLADIALNPEAVESIFARIKHLEEQMHASGPSSDGSPEQALHELKSEVERASNKKGGRKQVDDMTVPLFPPE